MPADDPAGRLAGQLRLRLTELSPAEWEAAGGEAPPPGLVDARREHPELVALEAPPWCAPVRFLVHPEVAGRLREASSHLPDGLRIGFWEGLRPVRVQQRLWDIGRRLLREELPDLDESSGRALLRQLIADPGEGTPPHSVGCAVDVCPVDPFGRLLAPTDAWGRLVWGSFSRAMELAGLVNYPAEWWHWSYGDEDWALANECAPILLPAATVEEGPGGGI